MKTRAAHAFWILITGLSLIASPGDVEAQSLRTTGYVTLRDGQAYVVLNNKSTLLEHPLSLTPELTVLTNGVITISGDTPERLTENRRVSLDGFWLGQDGTFIFFKPHYLMKARMLLFVKSGLFTRVDQDVTFRNGSILRTDGTILTADQRIIRLQDGQMLGLNGDPIPALDHIMIVDGRLVLQKDGSIIPLPEVSLIGMSEGTRLTGTGMIIKPNGDQVALSDGQRLTLAGAAMTSLP
jgi:hypothetical protein